MVRTDEISRALRAVADGERDAEAKLVELVYGDLKDLAHSRRARLGRNESLHTTDLVHESWLKLQGSAGGGWESRRHFFGAAANAMRNVIVDHARRKAAIKRGKSAVGGSEDLSEEVPEVKPAQPIEDVLTLHLALEELEKHHVRPARVVTLSFFGGLSMPEIAEVLEVSLATVERDWRFGRSWLQRAMGEAER